MKWQDFWDYISLQVWNFYGRKADMEEAKHYYPLTPEGEKLILDTGGGRLDGRTTSIAQTFRGMENQSPKQAIKPKSTGLIYPTIRRDSVFNARKPNFSRAIQKMELGRFPDQLLPFLRNNPNMPDWDAGFYLIRCDSPNYGLHVELQRLQNAVGATLRLWQESQADKNNEVSLSTDTNVPKAGPFVGNTGLHDLLQEVIQYRRQIRGGNWTGQLGNYTNMHNQPSYGFRRNIQLGVSESPPDLLQVLQQIMAINPEDMVHHSQLWLWIHIDKSRKGDLRDIHVVSVHNNIQFNIRQTQFDSMMWEVDSTMGPRWIGDPNSDLRKYMVDTLANFFDDFVIGSASPEANDYWTVPDKGEIRDEIEKQVSANAQEGDIIRIPLSIFSQWPDMAKAMKAQFDERYAVRGDDFAWGMLPDRDLMNDLYAYQGWNDVSANQIQGLPTLTAQVQHPRLYQKDTGQELPWSGNYQLHIGIKDAIVQDNTNGVNKTPLQPPLTDAQGTPLVDGSGEYPAFRTGYNTNFLNPIPEATLNLTNGGAGVRGTDSMAVMCQPRYYSTSGNTNLTGQYTWWQTLNYPGIGNVPMIDWQNPHSSTYDKDSVTTGMKDHYDISTFQDYEVTDQMGTTYKDPTKKTQVIISNYQMEAHMDQDGNIIQGSPSNRVDFAYSREKGRPDTVTWPELYSKITTEYYYSPTGFNLESMPDTGFTPFINWNKGFTRIVWEFIESSK